MFRMKAGRGERRRAGVAPMNVDLNACIRGSKSAWDQFVESCSGLIYSAVKRAYCNRPVDQQDIDDRIQDVFVQLVQNDFKLLRTFDPKRASLSTYLTIIARSVVYQHTQKRRVETVPLLDIDVTAGQSRESSEDALGPLNGLSERQRLVLQMLFEQGMSVEEAAHRLGVDPQTIRSTKHKALTRLREERDREGTEGVNDA